MVLENLLGYRKADILDFGETETSNARNPLAEIQKNLDLVKLGNPLRRMSGGIEVVDIERVEGLIFSGLEKEDEIIQRMSIMYHGGNYRIIYVATSCTDRMVVIDQTTNELDGMTIRNVGRERRAESGSENYKNIADQAARIARSLSGDIGSS